MIKGKKVLGKKVGRIILISIILSVAVLALFFGSLLKSKVVATTYTPNYTLKYTALGDSITSGIGVGSQDNYVYKFSNYINLDLGVTANTVNQGIPYWTSALILVSMNDGQYRNNIANANILTLYIGFNDFQLARTQYVNNETCPGSGSPEQCLINAVNTFNSNYDQIIAQIKSLNSSRNTAFTVATIYYHLVAQDLASGKFTIINKYLNQMNNHIVQTAVANNLPVTDIHNAFNGPNGDQDPVAAGYLIWPGYLHPTPLGHTVIANLLRSTGYGNVNNILTCLSTLPDVNNDHMVNSTDLGQVAGHFGLRGVSIYDIDHNGYVNSMDIQQVASKYGQSCK